MSALLLAVWLVPLVGALMAVAGVARAISTRHREFWPFSGMLIIQITTIGNEETVNEIIRRIRDYHLTISHRIWVVTEPWARATYPRADEVIVVPEEFRCRASYKARALEYSRRLRQQRGLDDAAVKVLFVDDDSLPTKRYIERAYRADYDVCEGIPTPRIGYGRWLSHMDDLRVINCLSVCSLFQGFGHPIHVHGEGLCVRASAEAVVTWDHPIFASEDLVFGQLAAANGQTWGFIWEYINITSPFTWKDFVRQRRRWLWGNIHAIRYILPLRVSILLVAQYLFGLLTFLLSTAGIVLVLTGRIRLPSEVTALLWFSLSLWLGAFVVSGVISSSGGSASLIKRVKDVVIAPLLALVTSAVAVGIWFVALFEGNPRRFDVIEKVDPRARRTSLADTTGFEPTGHTEPIPEPVIHLPDAVGSFADAPQVVSDEGSA